jgi:cell division transport system permease protein
MRASYIFQETLRGIARNRGSYILAAAVQAICLILLSIFVVITVNVNQLARAAGRRVELYAFLASSAQPEMLAGRIGTISGVAATRYVSKDEALEELKADMGEDGSIVEALGENPLPASIRVTVMPGLANAANLAEIERKVALMPGVAEVWSGRAFLDQLNRIVRTVLILDIGVLIIVSLAAAFIVFQTVEGSILTRRHEIEIMELVGASDTAVRLPFIIEGTSQGLLGGIVAFLLILVLYRIVTTVIPAPIFPVMPMLGFDVLFGCILGLAGSLVALSRILHGPDWQSEE